MVKHDDRRFTTPHNTICGTTERSKLYRNSHLQVNKYILAAIIIYKLDGFLRMLF